MKSPVLLLAAVLLTATGAHAAPFVVFVPPSSTQNYVLVPAKRPQPKTYDPYFYEIKGDKKKTTIKQDTSGNVTVKEKKKGKEKITVTNRYGNVIYKETKKTKKKK